ncbi:DUF6651 domain-containing protein [Xenorhabdus szentirmaii]|uniref:DUF6651 domain-containing protein n=1 Tax=Xenorhabdus szentirmaii DSM 16338 TaxID=1427518 RepID=W1IUW4_9GAMM|nr:DUF6651 domain-containing protein [Xenorhabdus szentirmaii]PHM30527.1 hypothetical protein Xsze_04117 [Xenorhabdus szentirmaii DSM 16338]CDL80985.1 conserved hypothetical protein [Xenorhabdus szentirmaii DSM 16338]
MNLWQMLMANRGILMDVADDGIQGGSGGGVSAGEPERKTEELKDDYVDLSQEQLINRLKASETEKANLVKETMKRKTENKSLTDKLAAFGDATPEQITELLTAKKTAEEEKQRREQEEQEKRGEFDAVKKQMIEAHQAELKGRDDVIATLAGEKDTLRSQILELTVGSAFSGSNFLREETLITPSKARVIYGGHFEVGEDGIVVGYDKPAGAKERAVLVDGNGSPLAFEQAIERILKADPESDALLRSKARPGAGSNTDLGAGGKPALKELNALDKIAAGVAKMRSGN